MAVRKYVRFGNTPALHSGYFNSTSNIHAKAVSVDVDRYKLIISPIHLDIGGNSYQLKTEKELNLNLDNSWDFGQNIGTWTANTEYSVGDWVRPTSGSSIWDGTNNNSTSYATARMTSVSTAGQTVSATSGSTTGGYACFCAFDQAGSTYWLADSYYPTGVNPAKLKLDIGYGKIINKYAFLAANVNNIYFPMQWSIEGSNNSLSALSDAPATGGWITLDTRENISSPGANAWSPYYTFVNNVAYRYYRFVIYAANNGGYPWITEIKIVEQKPLLYKCTSPGTSLSSEPSWGTIIGGTTAESGGPTWTCYYDYTSATNRAGTDFYIYACQPSSGTIPKLLISSNSTYPHGCTANNSRKIGGFHGLCGSVGTISGHALSGYLTGDILPFSVWDLKHRSASTTNVGLVYIPPIDKWCAIYLTSGSSSDPTIVFGGTILDNITWYIGNDAARSLKMRFPGDSEFAVLAFNSNEVTNILGSTDPVTVTAAVNTSGRRMISDYGIEGCAGQVWQWLADTSYLYDTDTAWTWKNQTNSKGQLNTQGTYGYVKLVAGGTYNSGINAGSLSRSHYRWIWTSDVEVGLRFIANNIDK